MANTLAIVEQVALYLGQPWKFNRLGDPSDWRYEITDGAGHTLIILSNNYQHKGKFRISGSFPRSRTAPGHDDYLTIGVSVNRSPKDIAADIDRRLIPHYLAAYDRAEQKYIADKKREEELQLIGEAIRRVTGGTHSTNGRSRRSIYFENGEAEIWSNGDITLRLSNLSPDTAIQLAAIAINSKKEKNQ